MKTASEEAAIDQLLIFMISFALLRRLNLEGQNQRARRLRGWGRCRWELQDDGLSTLSLVHAAEAYFTVCAAWNKGKT